MRPAGGAPPPPPRTMGVHRTVHHHRTSLRLYPLRSPPPRVCLPTCRPRFTCAADHDPARLHRCCTFAGATVPAARTRSRSAACWRTSVPNGGKGATKILPRWWGLSRKLGPLVAPFTTSVTQDQKVGFRNSGIQDRKKVESSWTDCIFKIFFFF